MHKIIPITDFDFLNTFNLAGYTSKSSYQVNHLEDSTSCSFNLKKYLRPTPYIKKWPSFTDDRERLSEIIAQGLSFGILENGHLIAITVLEYFSWNNIINIEQIEVIPEKRGMGIGTFMLNEVTKIADSKQTRIISLETQHTNGDAISFYQKNSFKIEGIDLSYYTNNDLIDGEIAIFMKKRMQ